MKKIVICLLLLSSLTAMAQNDVDALRYALINTSGATARSMSLGGAIGAMGGDISNMSNNPAGIGLYRKSELSFSPTLFSEQSKTSYLSNTERDQRFNFNIGTYGAVFQIWHQDKRYADKKGWKLAQMGFGVTRQANFNSNLSYSGYNAGSSLSEVYLERLNSSHIVNTKVFDSDPFGAGLAYDNMLIDTVPGSNNTYFSRAQGGNVTQSKQIYERGAMNELDFTVSGNYNDKLYLGGTIGMPRVNYSQTSTYTESDDSSKHADFKSFTLTDKYSTSGSGVNFKAGFIYRINNMLRVGLAAHSPTYFSLTDKFSTQMDAQLDTTDNSAFRNGISEGTFRYALTTPWRLLASGAVVIDKFGLITAEYEFADYSQSFFNFNVGNAATKDDLSAESEVNNLIQSKYTSSSTIKIGAEYHYDIFALRAGYAYGTSPFQSGVALAGYDATRQSLSFGAGIRDQNYYIDLGVVHNVRKQTEYPYLLNSLTTPAAISTINTTHIVVTLGTKF